MCPNGAFHGRKNATCGTLARVTAGLEELRYLEALVRSGSARAAGRELGVSASTVYRRVAELEATLGFDCLLRGKGVTPAARELAELARSTNASLQRISQRARADREDVRGRLRLTTLDGFLPLLERSIAELSQACPGLRLDVLVSDTGLSLRKGQAELGLALLERPHPTLIGRKLFPVRWGVYAKRGGESDVAKARWVVLGAPLEKSWLGEWESRHVPEDRIAVSTASRRFLVDLVAAGAGIGLLPAPLAAQRSDLVEIPSFRSKAAELTRSAWLLYLPELRRDPRVMAAVSVLVRELGGAFSAGGEVG